MIRIKRVYDGPDPTDGKRVLVDRLWPRGITKEAAQVDQWLKDLAPSNELRTWFNHDLGRWEEFRSRYMAELQDHRDLLNELHVGAAKGTITLLYAAKDQEHNNAVVLKELIGNA